MAIRFRKLLKIMFSLLLTVLLIVCLYLLSGARNRRRSEEKKTSVADPVPVKIPPKSAPGMLPQKLPARILPGKSPVLSEKFPSKDQVKDKGDDFFVSASGLSLWELCGEISSCFDVNILVFEDIKDKQIYGDIKGVNLKQVLDAVSWYCGVEYVEKDGIYYVGSNTKTIIVLPASGLSQRVESLFKDVDVKRINDKLVVYGSERDVAKVQSVYNDIVKQDYCTVRLYAVELSYDKSLTFGVDLEKSVKYAFSWENILENSYNPVQALAVSLYMSLETDGDKLRVNSLIDTDLGLLSGETVRLQLGQDEDRPVYSRSEYGDEVISSYSTQSTGLLLDLDASFDGKDWILSYSIENSEAKTSLVKSITKLSSKSRLNKDSRVAFLAKLDLQSVRESYRKGIPVLADIPYLGYAFKITTDREIKRQVYFIAMLRDQVPGSPLSSDQIRQSKSPLLKAGDFLEDLPTLLETLWQ